MRDHASWVLQSRSNNREQSHHAFVGCRNADPPRFPDLCPAALLRMRCGVLCARGHRRPQFHAKADAPAETQVCIMRTVFVRESEKCSCRPLWRGDCVCAPVCQSLAHTVGQHRDVASRTCDLSRPECGSGECPRRDRKSAAGRACS